MPLNKLEQYKYKPYSNSKIWVWQNCPYRFKLQYVDKVKVEQRPQRHFDWGKLLHLLMEHNGDMKKVLKSKEFTKDIWPHGILKKEDIKKAQEVYQTFVSSKAGKGILSKRELIKEFAIGLDEDFKMVPYDGDTTLLRGFIDAAYVDEKSNTLLIVDWKSGKLPEQSNFQQLLYYSLAMFEEMPYDRIILIYAYLEHGIIRHKIVTRDKLPVYQQALLNTLKKIEEDETFEKNIGNSCYWCEYYKVCQEPESVEPQAV
jgi:ATP-dependent exoDNAse (exonuclease V) beta subunit